MTIERSARPHSARLFSAIALAIVATLGVLYIVSQFLRNSVGVIAPNLAAEVGLSPMRDRAAVQHLFLRLRRGAVAARRGARPLRPEAVHAGVGRDHGGRLRGVRARARTPAAWSPAARCSGFGTACFLMAPLALYARWFAPERFSTLAGIHLGIGSLGALLATAPLAFPTASFGWRATFLGVGAFTVVIGLLTWLIVSDDPPGMTTEPRRETLRESIAGIWEVIRTPSIGRIFLVQLASYPSYVLVVGLWGGPYLTHIYGYDLKGRGDILFVAALAQIWARSSGARATGCSAATRSPILIGTAHELHRRSLLFAALGVMSGAAADRGVRAARLLDRHDLGGDVARPLAGAAASARALPSRCSTSAPWAAASWCSSSAAR